MSVQIKAAALHGHAVLAASLLLAPSLPAYEQSSDEIEVITVTAERHRFLGVAVTSSQGMIADYELTLTPAHSAVHVYPLEPISVRITIGKMFQQAAF